MTKMHAKLPNMSCKELNLRCLLFVKRLQITQIKVIKTNVSENHLPLRAKSADSNEKNLMCCIVFHLGLVNTTSFIK